jgi:hypothetical protein
MWLKAVLPMNFSSRLASSRHGRRADRALCSLLRGVTRKTHDHPPNRHRRRVIDIDKHLMAA